MLTRPEFRLDTPNPNPATVTDAEWWLWCRLHELEPRSALGGILANKPGFHDKGERRTDRGQGNSGTDYSIRDAVNRSGPWWKKYASALDWTFYDAQGGNYATINRYSKRLDQSGRDAADPRLDLILFEWYGQTDGDRTVEGWNEFHDFPATSDPSHLWHLHLSFLRSKCGDFWGMWALLTVLMGWTVAQWQASLPVPARPSRRPVVLNFI